MSIEDEEAAAVLKTVGRQIRLWREAAGLRQGELGALIGYSEEMVSSVERGRRAPKPEFLDATDEAVGAGGKSSATEEDVEKARYPKSVRDLKKLRRSTAASVPAWHDKKSSIGCRGRRSPSYKKR